jgi:type III restriction enzyme
LDDVIAKIEERLGYQFKEHEVVHTFGSTGTLTINGLTVHHIEPPEIADDRRVKVVLFKENLSTGWDCPRAETMMSFRHAVDYTHIAQLLGRMIRTPTQQHINVDESLNDVHLYLPHFNANTVHDVVEALRSSEGSNIPADIEAEEIGSDNYDTLTIRPTYTAPARKAGQRITSNPNQISWFDPPATTNITPAVNTGSDTTPALPTTNVPSTPAQVVATPTQAQTTVQVTPNPVTVTPDIPVQTSDFDRAAVVKAINDAGLLTYNVRRVRITDYLKSMFALARFLTQTRIEMDAHQQVIGEIVTMIHDHIDYLKKNNLYDALADQVLQFKLSTQIFDVFGKTVDNFAVHDMWSTTDADIERQFRLAETRLGNEGVGNAYCNRYFDNGAVSCRIDVIIFAADVNCMDALHVYARDKFHSLNDDNRRRTVTLPDRFKKRYDDIVSDGDIVSKHNFRLPETIRMPHETEGVVYTNHLFVDNSGSAVINLNGWEQKVIEEEQIQDDFVCWLRNPSRGTWALCIPYELDGEKKPTYPDFLIIRRDGPDYIVDVLEPHDPSRIDNLGKAKGFAEYARQNPGVGRIQLIKMKKDSVGKERPFRLDMSKSSIRDMISRCASIDELNHIFDDYGFFL